MNKIRIGTRASQLALAQADLVKQALSAIDANLDVEIVKIITSGDRISGSLATINEKGGGKGLFTKEIEESLLAGETDIAVHSMKDMPANLPEGLIVPCVLEREDPRDAFISYRYDSIKALPEGAVIGTSSVRRQAQILHIRPDLKIVPFRGNVPTRLDKVRECQVDATFLAVAGLKRIGREGEITAVMPMDIMLPAVAQGTIGIECRVNNKPVLEMLKRINHGPSFIRMQAERAFLKAMDGSCTTPIACLAEIEGDQLFVRAMIASKDGKTISRAERKGALAETQELGKVLAKALL